MKALIILAIVGVAFWYGVVSFNAPKAKEISVNVAKSTKEKGKSLYDTFAPKVSAKVSKILRDGANSLESKAKESYDSVKDDISEKIVDGKVYADSLKVKGSKKVSEKVRELANSIEQ